MPDAVAEFSLIGQKHGDAEIPVTVRIFQPKSSTEMSPSCECSVTVEPLHAEPFTIYGEDTFQALCLAAKFAVQILEIYVKEGGELRHEDGDRFDATALGFKRIS